MKSLILIFLLIISCKENKAENAYKKTSPVSYKENLKINTKGPSSKKDAFSRWKGNYYTNFTITRSSEDYELSYDIKIVRQDRVLISEKINGENNNLSGLFIKSVSENQLVIKSTIDDTLEYIISEIDGKYYIRGFTIYMLNPPNDRYPLTKSEL